MGSERKEWVEGCGQGEDVFCDHFKSSSGWVREGTSVARANEVVRAVRSSQVVLCFMVCFDGG